MPITTKNKDNIKGGIAKFINTNKRKDKTKENFIKKYNKDYYRIRKKFKVEYNKLDFTKRVIIPQKNKEKAPKKKMRILTQERKNLLRIGEGTFQSLMIRTPQSFPIKEGRKRINKSFDCGNRPNSIIYHDHNNKDKKYNHDTEIFGVGRKLRIKLINLESGISPIKFGKKQYHGKIKDSKIFF
jgi:hypothetical protein